MVITRRQYLLFIWVTSIVSSGLLVGVAVQSFYLGLATSFGLIAISLGVPLMRAFTEFSK